MELHVLLKIVQMLHLNLQAIKPVQNMEIVFLLVLDVQTIQVVQLLRVVQHVYQVRVILASSIL